MTNLSHCSHRPWPSCNPTDACETLQAAADHLEQRIGQYNPQNVCNILWTYATLGYYPGGSPLDVAADYALHALEVSLQCSSSGASCLVSHLPLFTSYLIVVVTASCLSSLGYSS